MLTLFWWLQKRRRKLSENEHFQFRKTKISWTLLDQMKTKRLHSQTWPSSNGKSIEIAMTVLFNNNYQSLFQLRKDNQDAFVKRHGIKMGFMSAFVKEHHTFKYHYLYINLACLSVCLSVCFNIYCQRHCCDLQYFDSGWT